MIVHDNLWETQQCADYIVQTSEGGQFIFCSAQVIQYRDDM